MVNFHKQRAITTESMVRYGPEDLLVLNNVTHKILIKKKSTKRADMVSNGEF